MTTIEDRLRATLAAEADRHPTTTDVEALRARADRTVVDLRLPPRRNRARLAAAAVVLAVLALGVTAVVADRDDGEPVATSPPPTATGWYLPGPDWDVVSIETAGTVERPGLVREVLFMAAGEGGMPQASVEVYRSTDPDALRDRISQGGGPTTRGTGADARTVLLASSSPHVDVAVARDDLVLHIAGYGMDETAVLALADAWWESGGRALPTPDGAPRVFDTTRPGAAPVAPGDVDMSGDPVGLAVSVEVRSADGRRATYDLSPPEPRTTPTGAGDADAARDLGLAAPEVPRPVAAPEGGEAWLLPDGSVAAVVPGAQLGVRSDERSDVVTDLLASLRPVTAQTWRTAVEAATPDPDSALLAATLAEAPVPDRFVGLDDLGPGGLPGVVTDEQPSTTVTSVGVGEGVLERLRAVADGVADEGGLADPVVIGFVGDTEGDVALAGADRLDPARWELALGGRWGRDDALSALDLAVDGDRVARHPGSATPACTGDDGPPADDVVVIEPAAPDACLTWSAVVVRIDADGLVAEVRLRLWEP